jgi:Ser/Thr protein kinase RdoA (MazF antagonist)
MGLPRQVILLRDVPGGNGNWLAERPGGERVVLRRYGALVTRPDLAYEHSVLRYLAAAGWVVPDPVGEVIEHESRLYGLTRYVPGAAIAGEDPGQQRRRGRDLARLHVSLRGLGGRLGQRPGWRPQHQAIAGHVAVDWEAGLSGLARVSPRTADWARAAAARTQAALAAIGARELPVMVIHGDFAEWNVHYQRDHLAGVIDFGLTHLDSRPYELAIARTYRAPHALAAYRAELARCDWPLSDLEEAAIEPVTWAFRLGMTAWELAGGLRTGHYDLPVIERQLSRAGTPRP